MDQTREHLENHPTPSSGIAGDVNRLKTDASATADELRDFIAGLKGRSPQEVLGVVSESGLVQATFQATLGCVVLLAVLTVLPWLFRTEEPAQAESATADASTTVTPAAGTSSSETSEVAATTGAPTGTDEEPANSDPARAAAAMGIDETKTSDPESNPLDNDNFNKLLDGLD